MSLAPPPPDGSRTAAANTPRSAIWDSNRNVRPSMKQPIQEDPQTNWAAAIAPFLAMSLTWFVPEGSVVGGTIAGVVIAIVFTAVMVYGEKRR